MALPKNRVACMSDLRNYFRKLDLLGGLELAEQKQLRKNIGLMENFGEASQTTPLRITHEDLWAKVLTSEIVVGARYIIKDFQTIYSFIENGVELSGGVGLNGSPLSPVFELLVTGIHLNKLDARAYVIGKDWEVEYDITQKTLSNGIKTKGRITWMRDLHGNSAFYDFKSIKFRRYKNALADTTMPIEQPFIDLYTFTHIINGVVVDASENELTEYNELKLNCYNNVFIGNTFNNIFEPECIGNTFIRGCHDSHIMWQSSDNTFNEPVAHTTGSIFNKYLKKGDNALSVSTTKTVHIVHGATIVSYLDEDTFTHQIIQIK